MGSPAMQWLQIQIFKCANIQRLPSLKGKLWIPGDNRTGTPPGEDAYIDGGKDIDCDGSDDGDDGGDGDGDDGGDGDGDGEDIDIE